MSVFEHYGWLTSACSAACTLAIIEAFSTRGAFHWLTVLTAIIGLVLVAFNGQRFIRSLRHELRQREQ